MSKVDFELLDQLTAWMQEGGFSRLTYTRGSSTVTLRLSEDGIARPPPPTQTITSPCVGMFLTTHPLVDESFIEIGSVVAANDIIALLGIGPILLPVVSPFAGTVRSIVPQVGKIVGFDDPLFEIEPAHTELSAEVD